MQIKSQKDFFSGLMFLVVGIGFAWGSTKYNVGTGARMGPGYFPLMLGVLLAGMGAVITLKSLSAKVEGGDLIGSIAWRPLCYIIGANLVLPPYTDVNTLAAYTGEGYVFNNSGTVAANGVPTGGLTFSGNITTTSVSSASCCTSNFLSFANR